MRSTHRTSVRPTKVGVGFWSLIVFLSVSHLFRFGSGSTASVAFVKSIDASGRIDEFLLTSKERMASRADFYVQVVFHRRASLERASARTDDRNFVVVWMYFRFHNGFHFFRRV
jgi:hypothetical protein